MEKTRPRRHGGLSALIAAACLLVAMGAAPLFPTSQAMADDAASSAADADAPTEQNASAEGTAAGEAALQEQIYGPLTEQAEEWAPEVRTLEDGTQVQRTPDDPGAYFQMGYWDKTSYNTYYLNADKRGCNACHADLAETVDNMDFFHLELSNGQGSDVTVMDCRICHDQGYGYVEKTQQLGSLIHGIHTKQSFKDMGGDCMSCHTATSDGAGLQLWDEAKYGVLQGITWDSEPVGEFWFDQDTTVDMFPASWFYGPSNVENIGKQLAGVEPDESAYETWDVTVSGKVDNPFQMTLADLIAEAPSETTTVTIQCIMNPPGGEQLANVEVTGIPISWVLEKAGVQDGATAVMSYAPDGWGRAVPLSYADEHEGYLVYKINGKLLDYDEGFPLLTVWEGQAAPSAIRWVCELQVVDTPLEDLKFWVAWTDTDGTGVNDYNGGHMLTTDTTEDELFWVNKPNVAIYHFHEGQIIEAGKPYTFEGYAYGSDETIAAVEFSLDNGKTWMSYETEGTDANRWVYWHYTYTPEKDSSYVLMVRAVTEDGIVSTYPDSVMFKAKAADDVATE